MKKIGSILLLSLVASLSFASVYRGESLQIKGPDNCSATAFSKLLIDLGDATPITESFRQINYNFEVLNSQANKQNSSTIYWYEMDVVSNGIKDTIKTAVLKDKATGECL